MVKTSLQPVVFLFERQPAESTVLLASDDNTRPHSPLPLLGGGTHLLGD
jgi:hypothetical protein